MATPREIRRRGRGVIVALVLMLSLVVVTATSGAVWTDQEDYEPGSTVTISGDNSNEAGYLAGETVRVDVSGPNDWNATCDAVAGDAGGWSCQVTLADGPEAVGEYEYTATGLQSGVIEVGIFRDAGFFLDAKVGTTRIAVTFPGNSSGSIASIEGFGTATAPTATCSGSRIRFQPSNLTTSTTGTVNLTSFGTAAHNSNRLTAPATVTIGGVTYAFSNWTTVNASVTQAGTVGCFSGWNLLAPTTVTANYVLAQGTLRVKKEFANAAGKTGNKTAADFSFNVNAGASTAFEADGQNDLTVGAGNYTVVEDAENGYTASYTNSANSNTNCTSIAVTAGNTTTCTVTNTFNGYTATTTTDIQDADDSIVIGNTIEDKATVTGDADGGDPLGNVDFYLCGPTDPANAYVACTTSGSKVKDNAALVSDGVAGTYTSTASYTVTAAQLTKAGKYCLLADYEGSTLYKGDADDGLTNECFTVTPASATPVYTGLFTGVAGTPTTLSATVTSGYQGCAASRDVSFELDGVTNDTTASATTGSTTTGSYTGTASTTKTLIADQYEVTASVADKSLDSDTIPECSEADSAAAVLSVAEQGSDAQGGGWYKVNSASPPRVNLGFAVKKQRDGSFKGQLLWMNNDRYKLKGSITGYGTFTCPTSDGQVCGVVTGTGTLYQWDSGTGTWGNPQSVGFSAKFWDGGQTSCSKKSCTKQERPDWFGMEIAAVTIAPESAPQQLMGGSVKAGA